MTALVIARVALRDAEKMKAYGAAAAETLAAHGGEVLMRGAYQETLLGDGGGRNLGVLRFPDLAAARAWFDSPEYQALAELREQAGVMDFELFQTA